MPLHPRPFHVFVVVVVAAVVVPLHVYSGATRFDSRLPRAGQACCGGPFRPADVKPGTQEVPGLHDFEDWLATLTGPTYTQRAERWVNAFRYAQQAVAVANASFHFAAQVEAKPQPLTRARALELLPQAYALRDLYHQMVTLLLGVLNSPGELGMLAAHEGGACRHAFVCVRVGVHMYVCGIGR